MTVSRVYSESYGSTWPGVYHLPVTGSCTVEGSKKVICSLTHSILLVTESFGPCVTLSLTTTTSKGLDSGRYLIPHIFRPSGTVGLRGLFDIHCYSSDLPLPVTDPFLCNILPFYAIYGSSFFILDVPFFDFFLNHSKPPTKSVHKNWLLIIILFYLFIVLVFG